MAKLPAQHLWLRDARWRTSSCRPGRRRSTCPGRNRHSWPSGAISKLLVWSRIWSRDRSGGRRNENGICVNLGQIVSAGVNLGTARAIYVAYDNRSIPVAQCQFKVSKSELLVGRVRCTRRTISVQSLNLTFPLEISPIFSFFIKFIRRPRSMSSASSALNWKPRWTECSIVNSGGPACATGHVPIRWWSAHFLLFFCKLSWSPSAVPSASRTHSFVPPATCWSTPAAATVCHVRPAHSSTSPTENAKSASCQ